MGKRKSRRKAPRKTPLPKLEQFFDCPFCCAVKEIGVTLRRKDQTAHLLCRQCGICYDTTIAPLDEAVDVFASWIDSCEEVNSRSGKSGASPGLLNLQITAPSRPVDYSVNRAVQAAQTRRLPAVPSPSKKKRRLSKQRNSLSGEDSSEDEEDIELGDDEDDEEEELLEAQLSQQPEDDDDDFINDEVVQSEEEETTDNGGVLGATQARLLDHEDDDVFFPEEEN